MYLKTYLILEADRPSLLNFFLYNNLNLNLTQYIINNNDLLLK